MNKLKEIVEEEKKKFEWNKTFSESMLKGYKSNRKKTKDEKERENALQKGLEEAEYCIRTLQWVLDEIDKSIEDCK